MASSIPARLWSRARRQEVAAIPVVIAGVGAAALAMAYPLPTLGLLFVGIVAVAVFAFPDQALVAAFVLIPFHQVGYYALTGRFGVNLGPLTLWKDALLVALLLRGVYNRWRVQGPALPRSGADRYLLVYVAGFLLLTALSPDLRAAVYGFANDAEGPLLLLAIVALAPPRRILIACLVAIVGVAVVMSGVALIEQVIQEALPRWFGHEPGSSEVYYSDSLARTGYRSGSFFGDSLVLGFFLSGATPIAVALVGMLRGRLRLAAVIALPILLAGTIATFTRSAYLGAGVALLLAMLLAIRNPRTRLSAVGIVALLGALATLAYVQSGDVRVTHAFDNTSHFDIVQGDIDLITSNPLGYGLGSTDYIARRFNLSAISNQSAGASTGPSADSVYLAQGIEGGIIGLSLFLGMIFTQVMRLRRARLRALGRGDPAAAIAAAGALAALAGISICGLLLPVANLPTILVLWGSAGVALVLCHERGVTMERAPAVVAAT